MAKIKKAKAAKAAKKASKGDSKSKAKKASELKSLIKKHKVTMPFFCHNGCIKRTSDGKWYPTNAEFLADGGAPDGSNVQQIIE